MSKKVEGFEVDFGIYNTDYDEAAEKVGISSEGVFLLTTYADLLRNGDIDTSEIVTARESLNRLADSIERDGFPDDKDGFANTLRYLANFTVDRPIPPLD